MLVTGIATAQDSGQKSEGKIIYQYKKYERFDLGDLEVQGNIIAPGDLSVKEKGANLMGRPLYDRREFSKEISLDVHELR